MTTSHFSVERSNLRFLLNSIKDEVKRELNCHAIGTIISFDSTTGTASVAFSYKKVLKQANAVNVNDYTDTIVDYPVLIRCPVMAMGGGGAWTTYPVFSGDPCLLLFCDRDIDLWLEKGSTTSAPNSERMHDISDAVALVGLNPVTKPISWATDAIQTIFGQVVLRFTNLLASIVDVTGQKLCQSGFLQPYAGSSAPSGWLLCYGQAVSRSTYWTLFAVIGTTFGAGDGSTTFNLPDCRGRTLAGLDNIGGSDASRLAGSGATTNAFTTNRKSLGGVVGECMHTQTIAELVSHDHASTFNSHSHNNVGSNGNGSFGNVDPTGGGLPFNVVQPTMMVNWIIKI